MFEKRVDDSKVVKQEIEINPARSDDPLVCFDFLPWDRFDSLRKQVEAAGGIERIHIPTHKRGGAIAYERLAPDAPTVIDFYRSVELLWLVSAYAGEPVQRVPDHDQNACAILIYEQKEDHIGWHYDWNFYNGRHFTALFNVVNQDASGRGTSSADLMIETSTGPKVIPTPPNTLVVFEGAFVRHCVRPLGFGQRRVVLSMTFCTTRQTSVLKSIARRFKDTAYFGVRALWT